MDRPINSLQKKNPTKTPDLSVFDIKYMYIQNENRTQVKYIYNHILNPPSFDFHPNAQLSAGTASAIYLVLLFYSQHAVIILLYPIKQMRPCVKCKFYDLDVILEVIKCCT